MAQLVYRTRGNSSPQGKHRVYFCSHPADQKPFLDATVKELLALVDCAVWYDPQPEEPLSADQQEERKTQLTQMQLFVIPVTRRLLTTNSSALAWEFPLAIEQRIPVLPILQEAGLESLFNEKCGDLQCLNPHQTDPTALPYEMQLKRYLESVLVGDELTAQVRAAFDAYIFLSYRKKDRQAAQTLMRLIHENDFCRDIAIWYDEYLIPGENFNQAIAHALEKSKLFVLAVTPHLLEQPNYVMDEEFPAAKNSGKPILPVEMIPADRAGLEAAYPGIPPCASGQDQPRLSEELKAALYGLALRENDNDPRHNFFIGLAYLAGIDVEVDKNRAVGLIRSAAQAELPEAMEKLAGMYRIGDGVPRSWKEYILWQQRLSAGLRRQWQEQKTEEHFMAYVRALWDLSDFYFELTQPIPARTIWEEELLPLCSQGREAGFFNAFPFEAYGYLRLGELCRMQGEQENARKWMEKALEWFQALCSSIPEFRPLLACTMSRLGDLCVERQELEMAQHWADKSTKLFQSIQEEELNTKSRLLWISNCNDQACICKESGELEAARSWYEKGLAAARELSQGCETAETNQHIANFYNGLGGLCLQQENLAEARHWYQAYLDLVQTMQTKTGSGADYRALENAYMNMGKLCQAENDLAATRNWYEKAVDIAQTLLQNSDSDENRQNWAEDLKWLGDLCGQQKDAEGARRYLQKAVEIYEALAKKRGLTEVWDELGVCLFKLAVVSDLDAALLRRSLSVWEHLVDACPEVSRYSQCRDTVRDLLAEKESGAR